MASHDEIIKNSGNNFHVKVVKHLRSKGWDVMVSPYYSDNQTNKPREIDIIAERKVPYEPPLSGTSCYIIAQLYIECKYINKDMVFWFDGRDLEATETMLIQNTPLKSSQTNTNITRHRYLDKNKVAKLFASSIESSKKHESEDFFKALNQVLNGLVYRRKTQKLISKIDANARVGFKVQLHYPIILCNNFSRFRKVDIGEENNSPNVIGGPNFELEVNYSYVNCSGPLDEFFLVDVVDFSQIDDYLGKINSDIDLIKSVIS